MGAITPSERRARERRQLRFGSHAIFRFKLVPFEEERYGRVKIRVRDVLGGVVTGEVEEAWDDRELWMDLTSQASPAPFREGDMAQFEVGDFVELRAW